MHEGLLKAVVKAVRNGVPDRRIAEFIIRYFEENADYNADEKELEKHLKNALDLIKFVKENSVVMRGTVLLMNGTEYVLGDVRGGTNLPCILVDRDFSVRVIFPNDGESDE